MAATAPQVPYNMDASRHGASLGITERDVEHCVEEIRRPWGCEDSTTDEGRRGPGVEKVRGRNDEYWQTAEGLIRKTHSYEAGNVPCCPVNFYDSRAVIDENRPSHSSSQFTFKASGRLITRPNPFMVKGRTGRDSRTIEGGGGSGSGRRGQDGPWT